MVEVIAEIGKDGKVTVIMCGFKGQSCIAEAERLLGLVKRKGVDLGVDIVQLTEEYYQVGEDAVEGRVG